MELFLFLAALASSIPLAWWLTRRHRDWRAWKVALFAATPVPGLIAILCSWIIVNAMMTPIEQCGVDACGMAMAAGFAGLGIAALLLVLGMVLAAISRRFVHPPYDPDTDARKFQ